MVIKSNLSFTGVENAISIRRELFGKKLLGPTELAAESISRAPLTLRKWAMRGDGPIQPVRADGGLLWRVSDLMKMAGEAV